MSKACIQTMCKVPIFHLGSPRKTDPTKCQVSFGKLRKKLFFRGLGGVRFPGPSKVANCQCKESSDSSELVALCTCSHVLKLKNEKKTQNEITRTKRCSALFIRCPARSKPCSILLLNHCSTWLRKPCFFHHMFAGVTHLATCAFTRRPNCH